VPAVNEKSRVEELTLRVLELTARVAELTRRIELTERLRGNGHSAPQTVSTVHDKDDSESPIVFHTGNGFAIVRPWESHAKPAPVNGWFCFRVSDWRGNERDVIVDVSRQLLIKTELRTCGRVQVSSQFWTCCAERQLANYVTEHDEFPDGNQLIVETLEVDEVLLVTRWGKGG
jgi:hypothetical protein